MSDDRGASTGAAPGRVAGRDRGQTTIDYAIGVSVFLLVVAFVFAFVPSLIAPFTDDATDGVVVADRAADRLTRDLLVADPTRPAVLDADCTVGFFDDGVTADDCRYDANASDLDAALGIGSPTRSVNVTIVDGSGSRTLDGTELAVGPDPSSGSDVSVSRRAVLLDDRDWTLFVRVW
ncbi:hypothetical protein GRX01_08690 [Halobaculum sp. WSA2]|uniref:Uncharacterized protein n=1 Tax=Halobaculum saliterrae TaxID=2073113 RepID=A0A6B0SXP9_9EURY|nr:hypothetical protein [Halobaculum saliterrae]MXR41413.1 hypothetical protein [Halobaculum saliterrae]